MLMSKFLKTSRSRIVMAVVIIVLIVVGVFAYSYYVPSGAPTSTTALAQGPC
jgi:flagellar basal body-associated protein FliL